MELPKISIVIANLNGRHHLSECFGSIKKLNYPKDKIEVIVVDNGSTDGSIELLRQKYSWVKLIRNAKNEGFAKPSNDGARAATGEYVAFLNNDMRVEKDWLIELVNSIREQNAQCAASLILSWNGDLLDFAGGSVNFYGLGYQYDFHLPLSQVSMQLEKDKQILFACGGAMLVDRALFLDAGGFDEDYFAYFEDVDFGWRFTLLGNKTVLSVKSRVRHKHNGTSGRIAKERVRKLCERNNLYTIFKNYGDEIFNRAVLPALLLDMHEAYTLSGINSENYDIGSDSQFDDTPVRISHMAALKYTALDDIARNAPKLWEKRCSIQSRRKTSDDELLKFITDPFMVFPKDTADFINTEYDFIKAFRLDEAFKTEFRTRVLLVTGDKAQSGRYEAMADALAKSGLDVTCCRPVENAESGGDNKDEKGVNFLPFSDFKDEKLLAAAKSAQITVADAANTADADLSGQLRNFAKAMVGAYIIADISAMSQKDSTADFEALDKTLKLGDFIICADDAQKQKWRSMLASARKLNAGAYSFNKTEDEIFAAVTKDDAEPLVDFCKRPVRLICQELIEEETADSSADEDGADDGGVKANSVIMRRLAEIDKQQKSISAMLKKNTEIVTETGLDVKDVLEQSNLMNSRFLKLKNSLVRFKLFSRFFK